MPRRNPVVIRLQPLEDRRVPATMVDPQTVTWQDANGNTATAAFSKPVITADNASAVFAFDTGSVTGDNSVKQQLQTLNLSGLPKGLSVTISGKNGTGGAVPVDVGFVNATGVDETAVSVSGDLGKVVAGDANKKTPGLGSLAVGSLGVRGTATQAAGGDLVTAVAGSLGKLTVAFDVSGAKVGVTGGIGKLTIGGSLVADGSTTAGNASIQATGKVGPVTIGGDVRGGPADLSGYVYGIGGLGTVSVGGSLTGGGGQNSGRIVSGKAMGKVTITGNLTGGTGLGSGGLYAVTGIGGVAIGGNLAGGSGSGSGGVTTQTGSLGVVTIGGNMTGGGGFDSAGIRGGKITSVTITGDLVGGSSALGYSGSILAFTLGPVTVHNLTGGNGPLSASITARSKVVKVTVTGNMTGGNGDGSASINGPSIGSVTVGGSVLGGAGNRSASIVAGIKVGKVAVTGTWTGASIAAGWGAGADGVFGTADDVANKDAKGRTVNGKITSITVGGAVEGTAASATDHFAFLASQITGASINGSKLALKPGPRNDNLALGTQGDFNLLEK